MYKSFLAALLCAGSIAVMSPRAMSADDAMAAVEKMMMAMPDTLDHAAVAAKYTAEAQALEEKAAMHKRIAKQYAATHNIPGQGSRSRHLAQLWEEMSAMYSHAAEAARKIAQMQLELVHMSGT